MDEDAFEEALRRFKEQARDVEALAQEHTPDLTTFTELASQLPEGSLERAAFRLIAVGLEQSKTDRGLVLEQRVMIGELLETALGLHRRVRALEEAAGSSL